jgi:hypothetical protein
LVFALKGRKAKDESSEETSEEAFEALEENLEDIIEFKQNDLQFETDLAEATD